MLPESETTFDEVTEWYLSLKSVKRLGTCSRIEGALSNFNAVFGNRTVDAVKRTDLENYQEQRLESRAVPAMVDKEVSIAKTMVTKAFDDDKIGGDVLKAFRTVKKKLKKGANARRRAAISLQITDFIGATLRNRTADLRITSALLYQLS